jgi:hypothetical protein
VDAIRWSLLGAAVIGAASAFFFWQCARTLREDLPGEDLPGDLPGDGP